MPKETGESDLVLIALVCVGAYVAYTYVEEGTGAATTPPATTAPATEAPANTPPAKPPPEAPAETTAPTSLAPAPAAPSEEPAATTGAQTKRPCLPSALTNGNLAACRSVPAGTTCRAPEYKCDAGYRSSGSFVCSRESELTIEAECVADTAPAPEAPAETTAPTSLAPSLAAPSESSTTTGAQTKRPCLPSALTNGDLAACRSVPAGTTCRAPEYKCDAGYRSSGSFVCSRESELMIEAKCVADTAPAPAPAQARRLRVTDRDIPGLSGTYEPKSTGGWVLSSPLHAGSTYSAQLSAAGSQRWSLQGSSTGPATMTYVYIGFGGSPQVAKWHLAHPMGDSDVSLAPATPVAGSPVAITIVGWFKDMSGTYSPDASGGWRLTGPPGGSVDSARLTMPDAARWRLTGTARSGAALTYMLEATGARPDKWTLLLLRSGTTITEAA
jgi:hypothetical protein